MVLGLNQFDWLAACLKRYIVELLDGDFELRRIRDGPQAREKSAAALKQVSCRRSARLVYVRVRHLAFTVSQALGSRINEYRTAVLKVNEQRGSESSASLQIDLGIQCVWSAANPTTVLRRTRVKPSF